MFFPMYFLPFAFLFFLSQVPVIDQCTIPKKVNDALRANWEAIKAKAAKANDQAPDAAKKTEHGNELPLNPNEIDHHHGHGKKSLATTDSNVLKELITKLVDLIDENDDGMTKNETQQFIERLDKKIQRENQRGKRAAPPPPEVGRVCAELKDAKNVLRHRLCTDEEKLKTCQEKDGNKLCIGPNYWVGKICADIECTSGHATTCIKTGDYFHYIPFGVCTDQKDATECTRMTNRNRASYTYGELYELCVITETETKGARACREAKGGDKQRAVELLRTGLQALLDAADADNDAKMTRQELELLWKKKEQGPLIWNVEELNLQLELIKCGLDGLGLTEWFQFSKLGAKKGAGGASMMTKEQIRAKIFGTN